MTAPQFTVTVYAATALSSNRRGETSLACRISALSEEDAIGKAILAVDDDGYDLISHHSWWETLHFASGMEAPSGGETVQQGSTGGDSPTGNAGDAQ